ncbi:glucosyl-3-phosphoglycerate synthase [Bailinhaonella thermotolerans]|uniref:glucosyl-3-phosphoglycerate synthase n=1 Tax=Bailinhaonella thermotolerans TaxID=1070861 RepID=UPI00192A39A5|nr:glucosyl-3-phosphoglycerate synthase [Bailinhaonella thermotolerans]
MLPEVREWLSRRSSSAARWPAELLMRHKGGTRVSVVLPARNEEATIGEIVGRIHRDLVVDVPLIDELVVLDSRSSDRTAELAVAAGAVTIAQDSVLPGLTPLWGKGEALWKSLAVTTGDVIVFVDSDIRGFTTDFITGLLGPLLTDPTVMYVKGHYDRPLHDRDSVEPAGGGRVTELVARPLLNMFWPQLAGIVQPLAGEYAGRREVLEAVPFVCGYGVEFGLLVDLVDLVGLEAFAQVDLGERVHANQSTQALGRMAGQIISTAWTRLHRQGLVILSDPPTTLLTQFVRMGGELVTDDHDVRVLERPPMAHIRALREGR